MNPQTYRSKINQALKPLGLKIFAGPGYSYFKDAEGNQVGDSVMIYRQSDQPVEAWVADAKQALEDHHRWDDAKPTNVVVRKTVSLTK